MAPQLYSLYQTAMTSKQDLAQQRLQATAAERSFWPDATQEATAAAVAADEMAAAEAAEPEAALNGGDALDFGGPVDMAGVHDDRMDASAGAAQPGFSDQGFGAGSKTTPLFAQTPKLAAGQTDMRNTFHQFAAIAICTGPFS